MLIAFKCPCGKWLSVGEEMQRQRLECPECGNDLTVPVPQELTEPDVLPPRSIASQPAPDPETPAWITTRDGLSVSYYGLLFATIATIVLGTCLWLGVAYPESLVSAMKGDSNTRIILVAMYSSTLTGCMASGAMLAGWVLCCKVPARIGAQWSIYAALVSIALAFAIIVLILYFLPSPKAGSPPVPDAAGASTWRTRDPSHLTRPQQPQKLTVRVPTLVAIGFWLSMMLALSSQVFFTLFLGAIDISRSHGWTVACIFFQVVAAVWVTLLCLANTSDTLSGMATFLVGVAFATNLLADVWLLYGVRRVRDTLEY
jgi:hypothetical protein